MFVVFETAAVIVTGPTKPVESATGRRQACASCGSVMSWTDATGRETELYAGHFPSEGLFTPEYEVWVKRREPWMPSLSIPQYEGDRPTS